MDPKINTPNLILTRYLYALDDVYVCFIDALLNKNAEEALWWFFEYYYSLESNKEHAWQLLFEVYYDYYALYYPKMEKFIYQKYHNWRFGEECDGDNPYLDLNFVTIPTQEIRHIVMVIKNLAIRRSSYDIFIVHQTVKQIGDFESERKNYRFRKNGVAKERQWLVDFNFTPELYSFIWALHKRDWLNICFWINVIGTCEKTDDDKFEIDQIRYEIVRYFAEIEKIPIDYSKSKTLWNAACENYKNKCHMILALVVYMCKFSKNTVIPDDVSFAKLYVKETKEEIAKIIEWNTWEQRKSGLSLWRVLYEKRLYSVSRNLNCFSNLARYGNGVDMLDILRNHWLEYCYLCPLWNKRFEKYGARLVSHSDGKPKCIVFASERGEEEWMENYNYEPDEQPRFVQNKSVFFEDDDNDNDSRLGQGEGEAMDEDEDEDQIEEVAKTLQQNLIIDDVERVKMEYSGWIVRDKNDDEFDRLIYCPAFKNKFIIL